MSQAALFFRNTVTIVTVMGFALPVMAQIYDRVEVKGAEFIPEDDIRMTCGELEGVLLDAPELRLIEDCLMSTGVFERVSITGQDGTLTIDVTEIKTRPGRIDAGVALGNNFGVSGTISYEQFNLIPGALLGINTSFSSRYRSYAINLFHSETFGPNLHFGLDIAGERARHEDLSFSTRKDLIETYLAWTPQQNLRLDFGVGLRDHRLLNLDIGASSLLRSERGAINAPFLHFAIDYEHTSDGSGQDYSLRLDQYFWNLGTSSRVSETRLDARSRLALGENTSLLLGFEGGVIVGQKGYQTTVLDRAFVGGENFRGFAPRGIGPSDSGDMLGGNRYIVGSVELRQTLGTLADGPVEGGIFMDYGSVWSLDNTLGGTIDDTGHFRSSIGVSFTFDVVSLPVSLYLATPVKARSGDKRQVFGLSANARF